MRLVPIWMMLPMLWLAGCQSTTTQQETFNRPCSSRAADAGTCSPSSIYVFPELSNVR